MAWMKITLRMRPSEDGEADKEVEEVEEVEEEDEEGGKSDKEDEDEDEEGGRGIANEADPEADPEAEGGAEGGAGEAEKARNSWMRSVRGWWIWRRRWSSSQ